MLERRRTDSRSWVALIGALAGVASVVVAYLAWRHPTPGPAPGSQPPAESADPDGVSAARSREHGVVPADELGTIIGRWADAWAAQDAGLVLGLSEVPFYGNGAKLLTESQLARWLSGQVESAAVSFVAGDLVDFEVVQPAMVRSTTRVEMRQLGWSSVATGEGYITVRLLSRSRQIADLFLTPSEGKLRIIGMCGPSVLSEDDRGRAFPSGFREFWWGTLARNLKPEAVDIGWDACDRRSV